MRFFGKFLFNTAPYTAAGSRKHKQKQKNAHEYQCYIE